MVKQQYMATILLTGGTGLIGKPLAASLVSTGHEVIILTRNPSKQRPVAGISYAAWDIDKGQLDKAAFAKADHIIHLAGAGVAEKRWTVKRKQEIIDSRVKSGELLVRSLKEIPNRVRTLVNASAIGWYGIDPQIPNPQPFREEDPAASDFLGQACEAWERTLQPLSGGPVRVAIMRTGIVLSREGGALKEFLSPMKFGLATILSKGKQMISWIHITDMVRLYVSAVEDEQFNGVYNAVAPRPVPNSELVQKLADQERGRFHVTLHVPAFALRMALGEMSTEVLKSTTVSCDKLHVQGFSFQYPSIDAALKELTA